MVNTLQGYSTIGAWRNLVARYTDQPTPSDQTNVTIDDYTAFLNESRRELTGELVDSYQDYVIQPDVPNPFVFATNGTAWQYPLPNDLWKFLGCDWYWTPGDIALQQAVTMTPFTQLERNRGLYQQLPPSGAQILVRYVPLLPDLQDFGIITCSNVQDGDTLWLYSSPQVPTAAPTAPGVYPALPGPNTTGGPGNAAVWTYEATQRAPVNAGQVRQFQIGANDAETAANLAAAMIQSPVNFFGTSTPWSTGSRTQDQSVALVTSQGNQVQIQLLAPLAIVWGTSGDGNYPPDAGGPAVGLGLDPLPVPSFSNPYAAWSNFAQTVNGWEELLIADACIKVADKQEQVSEGFRARKAALLARIAKEKNNRNAAQYGHITRVQNRRGAYGSWGLGQIPNYKITGNLLWLRYAANNSGGSRGW